MSPIFSHSPSTVARSCSLCHGVTWNTGIDIKDISTLNVLIFSLLSFHDPKYIQEKYFVMFISIIFKVNVEKLSGQA